MHKENYVRILPADIPHIIIVRSRYGPTRFWPTKQGGDGQVKSFDQQLYTGPTATGPAFECGLPAGSLVIFTSSTIHGRNTFKVPYGQRYVRF